MHAPGDVRVEDRPDPRIVEPTDAIIRLSATCICGSDLWPYRGVEPVDHTLMGHEYVGVVEEVGDEVQTLKVGDFVVAPFAISDGTCVHCRNGITTSCVNGTFWGSPDHEGHPVDGGQGELVRLPWADGTLAPTVNGDACSRLSRWPSAERSVWPRRRRVR